MLLILNGVIGLGTYKLLTSSKISLDKVDLLNDSGAQYAYGIILGLQLLMIILFATQNRFIIADNEGIRIFNPLIPIFKSEYRWTDFDYYVTVEESSQHATHEAIWLIKDQRLKVRFSSFYYSNYDDLIDKIRTPNKGVRDFNPFDQLFILIGLKGVREK